MPPPVVDQSRSAPGTLAPNPLTRQSMGRCVIRPKFNLLDFAKQTLKTPTSIGAIAPSSRHVANTVVSLANLHTAKTVVELGPGSGVFTEQIVSRLDTDSVFFAVELNQVFVQATRNRCPKAQVYHDTAQSIKKYLNKHNVDSCDCIVSSLPWTIFEPAQQDALLDTLSSVLAPGGCFVSIVYLGAKTRRRGRHFIDSLPRHFKTTYKAKTVWQNVPPTQIYRCVN